MVLLTHVLSLGQDICLQTLVMVMKIWTCKGQQVQKIVLSS